MKKFSFIIVAVVALSLISCNKGTGNKYLDQALELADQLNESVEKQDTAAVMALDKTIHEFEDSVIATGDTATLARVREALMEPRMKSAPMITVAKIESGTDRDEAIQDLVNDALVGGVSISAVTSAVDETLSKDKNDKKVKKDKE